MLTDEIPEVFSTWHTITNKEETSKNGFLISETVHRHLNLQFAHQSSEWLTFFSCFIYSQHYSRHSSQPLNTEVCTIIKPIIQMGKMRHRATKSFVYNLLPNNW